MLKAFDREKCYAITKAFQAEKALINEHVATAQSSREHDEWVAMRELLVQNYRADLDAAGFPRPSPTTGQFVFADPVYPQTADGHVPRRPQITAAKANT